jgi:hypothetical protein
MINKETIKEIAAVVTMLAGDNIPDKTMMGETTTPPVKQNNTGTYPMPGQVWKHYKGGMYEVIAMCNHTDTNESLVIYRSLSFGGFHARPYSEWHDEMKDGGFWLGKRFKLIK